MYDGASFGPYKVVRKLGQGGMGEVYLGEHTLIGRRAAIKVLHADRSAQRESVERFFNEARATSAVADAGIVQIFDFGITPAGVAYLVMEFLEGESLSMRLRKRGRLSPTHAVLIARQIAGSLAAAHTAGIVHRDLKPENLFMIRDAQAPGGERPKILDFGIAKLGDERPDRFRTRTGAVMGTPAYMSPEQCNDTGNVDHRTDIYSLGCVLFHLLTGRPPFDVEGVGATISAHLREPPPAPSSMAPGIPPHIDPLIARCLAKRPEDRFATMLELQQACDAALAQLPAVTIPLSDSDLLGGLVRENATTLGASVGQTSASGRPARLGIWLAVGAAAIAIGVVMGVKSVSRSASGEEPAAANHAPAAPPATAPADAAATAIVVADAPAAQLVEPVAPAVTAPAAAVPSPSTAKKPPVKKHHSAGDLYEDRN